jgi:hypothetical protein
LLMENRFSFRDVVTPYLRKKHFVLLSRDDPAPVILRMKGVLESARAIMSLPNQSPKM